MLCALPQCEQTSACRTMTVPHSWQNFWRSDFGVFEFGCVIAVIAFRYVIIANVQCLNVKSATCAALFVYMGFKLEAQLQANAQ